MYKKIHHDSHLSDWTCGYPMKTSQMPTGKNDRLTRCPTIAVQDVLCGLHFHASTTAQNTATPFFSKNSKNKLRYLVTLTIDVDSLRSEFSVDLWMKAHLFSIPFLTAPTNAICIDDACASTTTSWIAAHINFNLINRLGLTI